MTGGSKNPVTAIPSSPSVGQQRSPCTCFALINQKLRYKNKPKHSQQVLRRLEKLRYELAESGIPDILTLFINWDFLAICKQSTTAILFLVILVYAAMQSCAAVSLQHNNGI